MKTELALERHRNVVLPFAFKLVTPRTIAGCFKRPYEIQELDVDHGLQTKGMMRSACSICSRLIS